MSRNAPGVSPATPARWGQIRRELPPPRYSPVGPHQRRTAGPLQSATAITSVSGCLSLIARPFWLKELSQCFGGQAEFCSPALDERPEPVPFVEVAFGGGIGQGHRGDGGVAVQGLAGEPGHFPSARQAIAARETRVAARLREQAYRTANERSCESRGD